MLFLLMCSWFYIVVSQTVVVVLEVHVLVATSKLFMLLAIPTEASTRIKLCALIMSHELTNVIWCHCLIIVGGVV